MTPEEMDPNICSSALREDGTLDPAMIGQTDAYGTKWGAHRWDAGKCAECGAEFDTANVFPAIVYYYQKDGERNAGVFMTQSATREDAMRYMDAQEWGYDEESDIEVYALNNIEDEAGNEYAVEAKKK